MLHIQSQVANERVADMRRTAARKRLMRAAQSAHEDRVPAPRQRFRRRRTASAPAPIAGAARFESQIP